jgi:3-isopropylmalate/(R)-2-methylmalate dehydratase small subunit
MKSPSAITTIRARGIAIHGNEIDTDRIIPARFLRCVTFDGLGEQAFRDERFESDGTAKTHPMNDKRFSGAGVMAVNGNFGCGSSREHAPQALARWGIKALVGESFADIFAGNCGAIGVPVVTAAAEDIAELQESVEKEPDSPVTVNLETLTVETGKVLFPVRMPESQRRKFLSGTWDTLADLLANAEKIKITADRLPPAAGGPKAGGSFR